MVIFVMSDVFPIFIVCRYYENLFGVALSYMFPGNE
jgi:hypothetical protein